MKKVPLLVVSAMIFVVASQMPTLRMMIVVAFVGLIIFVYSLGVKE